VADMPCGDAGTVVTYLDMSDPHARELRSGTVAGIGVSDPDTDVVWVPIDRPGLGLTLVDPALIMPVDGSETAIGVLAGALAGLAGELHELDEDEPFSPAVARIMLARFARVIQPIEAALDMLVDADPSGALSIVLTCIGSATDEFEQGHVTSGKMGILVANAAIAELVE
jgi:hypothetical protein